MVLHQDDLPADGIYTKTRDHSLMACAELCRTLDTESVLCSSKLAKMMLQATKAFGPKVVSKMSAKSSNQKLSMILMYKSTFIPIK